METLRCPTCLSMLLVLDAGQQRCPMCRTRFGSRTQPVVLGENRANTAAHPSAHARTSGPEYAPSAQYATTRVEVDEPVRHRRRRRATKTGGTSAAPICEALFEAAALVEPQPKTRTPFAPPAEPTIVDIPEEAIRDMRTTVDAPEVFYATTAVKPKPVREPPAPVANVAPPVAPSPPAPSSAPVAAVAPPVPAPVAAPVVPPAPAPVRISSPIARVVAPPAARAPLVRRQPEPAPVDSIYALPPEPGIARVRWWDRLPLRWTIAFVERPEPGPALSEPAPRPKPRAVEAPKAPAPPPACARVAPAPAPDSPRPAPQPREPNPMWRDRVFRGAPDDVQLAPVTWPRRSDA